MPVSTMLIGSMMSGAGGGSGGAGGGAANIAGGLVSGITGFFQRRKAKRELDKLSRPTYTVPNEVLQNQKLAQQRAQEGLPSEQYSQAMQGIQRQQSQALTAAGGRKGVLMALPGIQQQSNDAQLGLNVKNAQARMDNERQLYGINSEVAGYRDKEFNINQMQPYNEKYNYYQSLLGAGNQNLMGGVDKILGGAGSFLGAGSGGGGGKKKYSGGAVSGTPNYYNGYSGDSDYSGFETGF